VSKLVGGMLIPPMSIFVVEGWMYGSNFGSIFVSIYCCHGCRSKYNVNTVSDNKNKQLRKCKKKVMLPRALYLYEQDYSLSTISEQCEVHISTLRRWLRDAGVPPQKKGERNLTGKPLDAAKVFDGTEHLKNPIAVKEAALAAQVEEEERLDTIAAAQSSPADQYQSYMASNAVKLMRDGIARMRPPTNVREMEVLDKIARRHFGLDQQKGGGANSLSIDINILNNAAAAAADKPKTTHDIDI
jgi:transposase-like protein